jgi:hypothetical protein
MCHFCSSVRCCGTQCDAVFHTLISVMVGQTMNWLTPTSTVSCRVIHYMYTSNGDFMSCTSFQGGHAIAQGVSCWLPTVVAWVRSQVKSCGICGGPSGTGAGCLRALQFHLPILIPPNTPSSGAGTIAIYWPTYLTYQVDSLALGQVFSEYFGFPCQSSFHQLLHNHPDLSSGACTIGQKWPQYLVDLVPPH